jgi:hypothetical protein
MKMLHGLIIGLLCASHIFAGPAFDAVLGRFTLPSFTKGNPVVQAIHREVIDAFGNKTFNLCVLNALAQSINNQVLAGSSNQFAVPPFMAISSQDIATFLNTQFKLDDLWNEFKQAQGASKELVQEAMSVLTRIRSGIAAAFSPGAIPQAMQDELKPFIKADRQYMVRSTGYEDRTDIANAGGNESVAAVPAEIESIWQAMSIVVQSYFSEKSLKQRLLAGDNVTKNYFIPVLIQQMVGEPLWTGSNPPISAIPVSGVMFSQESAGDTPGVVHVQSAFGHNQGVVNSLVAVDSYYMGPSGIIHSVIRKKVDRFVAVKTATGVSLDRMANPQELQARPSLASVVLHDLDKIARTIQEQYKHAMDIEFVVQKRGSGGFTIYLVQARPLIPAQYSKAPNYITDEYLATLTDADIARGDSIGTAGGFVRDIKQMNEIIMKDDLPQALNAYHDDPERKQIQVVFVSKMAPATSHEATQFKGYGVPVLVMSTPARQKIERFLAKGGVLVDTQRALVVPVTDKQVLAQGWYTHPIPMATSISSLKYMTTSETAPLMKKYAALVQELAWKSGDSDDTKQSMRDLVMMVKKSETDRAAALGALKRIVRRVFALIENKKQEQEIDAPLLEEAKRLLENATVCACEILFTIDTISSSLSAESKRMVYLYPIKFLEAVLFQQDNPEIVSCYSYLLLVKKLKEDTKAIAAVGEKEAAIGNKPFAYLVQLEKVNALLLTADNQVRWQQFIKKLAAHVKEDVGEKSQVVTLIQRFAGMVVQLKNLNVLDLWVNSSFLNVASQDMDALSMCTTLIDEIDKDANNKELLIWMDQAKPLIDTWNGKVEAWADPNRFDELYAQFQDQIVGTFIAGSDAQAREAFKALMQKGDSIASHDASKLADFANHYAPLITRFNRMNGLGKLLMIPFMRTIIDLYDRTIKSMTGSPLYTDKKILLQRFVKMLMPYVGLMEEMTVLVASHEKELFTSAWGGWDFNKYLTLMHRTMREAIAKPGESLLRASRGFSVAASQIGSQIDYNRARPTTWEDIFTLAHQNMLVILASLNSDYGMKQSALPPLITTFYSGLVKIKPFKESKPASLVGIDYTYPQLMVYFNLPLRQHSATFDMSYDARKPQQVILTCNFYGHNEGNRMRALMLYAYLASQVSHIEFASLPESTLSITTYIRESKQSEHTKFSWIITNKTSLDEVQKYLDLMAHMTIDYADVPASPFRDLNKIKPFLQPNSVEIIGSNKYSFSLDEDVLKTIPEQKLRAFALDISQVMTQQIVQQEPLLNSWLVMLYLKAQMYEKAVELLGYTYDYIIQHKAFDEASRWSMDGMLWEDCLLFSKELIENSSLPENIRTEARKQVSNLFNPSRILQWIVLRPLSGGYTQLNAVIRALPTIKELISDEQILEDIYVIKGSTDFIQFRAFVDGLSYGKEYYMEGIDKFDALQKELEQKIGAKDPATLQKIMKKAKELIEAEK